MKVDRRSFLSFVIGGAAGTALSPLPFKITDDLAIWSQNWPWTPVPPDGAASYTDTTCTLCPGGCGITVRKIEDRAVKIEGRSGHPINNGGICLLGLSGLQLLYGPSRIKGPQLRMGKRGEGKWRTISWDKAISLLGDNLGQLRSQNRPHALGCILGSDRGTVPVLFARFMTAFGSPNFFRTPSLQDSFEMAVHMMQGAQATAGFDVENANFVLSFGSGLIEGWGSPVRMFTANSLWQENGSKVIQFEPRLSNTAAKAGKWVPINPGTEAAMAMGLAHIIIKASLYNETFVANHSFGFLDWTDNKGVSHQGFRDYVLENYPVEKVSKITGVDAKTIDQLAFSFARASKPLALCGRGQGDKPISLRDAMAVHALNALVGGINREGGFWTVPEPDYIDWPELEMDRIAANGMQQERVDAAGGRKYPHTRYLLSQLVETILSANKSPLQTLLVSGADPLYTLPDSSSVRKALEKVPFVVSFSSFMDETAANADLILPNHIYLESYQDVPAPVGIQKPFVGLAKPVVAPQFNTRHVGDVIMQVARRLEGTVGAAFPWENYESCLETTFKHKWEDLVEEGFWMDSGFKPASWAQGFETPSGKFEFYATALKEGAPEASEALPHYAPVEPEGDKTSFPLILIPYDTMRLANDEIGNPPFLTKTVSDTVLKGNDIFIEINPATAKKIGLANGRYAMLSTPRGSVKVKLHFYDGIMPGIMAMPRGLGHTAFDEYLSGKGANFNELIGPVKDPASGLDVAWGIRAVLSRA